MGHLSQAIACLGVNDVVNSRHFSQKKKKNNRKKFKKKKKKNEIIVLIKIWPQLEMNFRKVQMGIPYQLKYY